jgi:hypothetical protein
MFQKISTARAGPDPVKYRRFNLLETISAPAWSQWMSTPDIPARKHE